MQLEPCPSCHRHVRTDEAVCPFCAASIESTMGSAPPRAMPERRLGRAALMSFGLTVAAASGATLLESCRGVPAYGAPWQPEDDEDAGTVPSKDAGRPNATPAYGAPPVTRDAGALDAGRVDAAVLDAGRRAAGDAGDTGDAGDAAKADAATVDADPIPVVPPYGAPTPVQTLPSRPRT